MKSIMPWDCVLDARSCGRAFDIVWHVAEKLAAIDDVTRQVNALSASYWEDTALVAGYPSLSLFFLYLFKHSGSQDTRWLDLSDQYLQIAGNATLQHPLGNISLAKGSCGVATLLSETENRYEVSQLRLDAHLCEEILRIPWKSQYEGYNVINYDIISGMSGILRYLIKEEVKTPLKHQAIDLLLGHLIDFIGDDQISWFQRWSIPRTDSMSRVVNCGLAHGVPGPLAALSLASLAGYDKRGQREAIQCAASWLCHQTLRMPWGIDWPAMFFSDGLDELKPARSAWCYGAPGILRALTFASQVLHDPTITATLSDGIHALVARPIETRDIDSLTLCHGRSGLLLILLHFWQETKIPHIRTAILQLFSEILAEFDEKHPFDFSFQFRNQVIHSPGLLYGSVGPALVLLAAATTMAPRWDQLLLIS